MVVTLILSQSFMAITILQLVLLQNANSTRQHDYESQTVKILKDNPVKDLILNGVKTDNAGISPSNLRIKRQSDRVQRYPRKVPIPILVGGIGAISRRQFGAGRPTGRGFGSRPVGARSFDPRGVGGRGIGGRGVGGGRRG